MQFTFSDAIALLGRVMHIWAAMAAVGGMIFLRIALLPAAATLADPARAALQDAVRRRWAKVVMMSISMLIVSGLYNFIKFFLASKEWPEAWKNGPAHVYQALFGVKILLALVIFFISSTQVGRSPALARFRENAKFWITLNLALALVLVVLSGELRLLHGGPPAAVTTSATTSTAPH